MILDQRSGWQRWAITVVVALVVGLGWFLTTDWSGDPDQEERTDPVSGLAWVDVDDLPVEAHDTLELIDAGGPFPHDRDGITFGNREGILPEARRGHYREYTVETPGLDHRGPRRIVTGGEDAGHPDEFYWTEDHYESFERIAR
ncbi:ribonuclease domain-containing protein [Nocardioides sp. AE5]|uniref:ribonuclease domain-containing protein n=1 Tax=Nocardioides sp. AE5 TaxID=2962573 RepID=UPI002880FF7A|nr:ribonuclease domain-containing protein [Nocardioides sp. AE5]MDT0201233.1 ribonuclease domain-containing protein [Nocardioides sp. AE5]